MKVFSVCDLVWQASHFPEIWFPSASEILEQTVNGPFHLGLLNFIFREDIWGIFFCLGAMLEQCSKVTPESAQKDHSCKLRGSNLVSCMHSSLSALVQMRRFMLEQIFLLCQSCFQLLTLFSLLSNFLYLKSRRNSNV